MKLITVVTMAVVLVGLLWWNTANGIPNCLKAGYNANLPGLPYDSVEGWYSNCYIYNGRWIASPVRCGLVNPANTTAGYKVFDGKICAVPPPTNVTTTTTQTPPGLN